MERLLWRGRQESALPARLGDLAAMPVAVMVRTALRCASEREFLELCAAGRQSRWRRGRAAGLQLLYRPSTVQRSLDRFGFAVDDGQENAGRPVGDSATLFPVLHGAGVQSEPVRQAAGVDAGGPGPLPAPARR